MDIWWSNEFNKLWGMDPQVGPDSDQVNFVRSKLNP